MIDAHLDAGDIMRCCRCFFILRFFTISHKLHRDDNGEMKRVYLLSSSWCKRTFYVRLSNQLVSGNVIRNGAFILFFADYTKKLPGAPRCQNCFTCEYCIPLSPLFLHFITAFCLLFLKLRLCISGFKITCLACFLQSQKLVSRPFHNEMTATSDLRTARLKNRPQQCL